MKRGRNGGARLARVAAGRGDDGAAAESRPPCGMPRYARSKRISLRRGRSILDRVAREALGCEAEPLRLRFGDLESELPTHPALLRVSDSVFLAILKDANGVLRVLTPNWLAATCFRTRVATHSRTCRTAEPRPRSNNCLRRHEIPAWRRSKTVKLLLSEQLGERRFDQCWILRVSPGARRSLAASGQRVCERSRSPRRAYRAVPAVACVLGHSWDAVVRRPHGSGLAACVGAFADDARALSSAHNLAAGTAGDRRRRSF